MPLIQQLFDRDFLIRQRALFQEQVAQFDRRRGDVRGAIGDLSIVTAAGLAHVALIMEDAGAKATELARRKGSPELAEQQMAILRGAVKDVITTIVAEGGDIFFDTDDKLYDPALTKVIEKALKSR